jgi:RNA polymerase sigma-70 factor (ECF subfamily)
MYVVFGGSRLMSAVPGSEQGEKSYDWARILELYRAHRNMLVGRVTLLMRSQRDAEDVVQETFIKLARHWRTLRNPEAAVPWLYRTAANEALNRLTRRYEVPVAADHQGLWARASAAAGSPEQVLEVRHALSVLDALPPGQRQAYLLRYFFGLRTDDIAAWLGCSRGAVHARLSRAEKAITKLLGAENGADGDCGRVQGRTS